MTPTAKLRPRLLTVADVAEELQLCERSVRRLITRGDLCVHRVGRAVRVSADDLEGYLAKSRSRGRGAR